MLSKALSESASVVCCDTEWWRTACWNNTRSHINKADVMEKDVRKRLFSICMHSHKTSASGWRELFFSLTLWLQSVDMSHRVSALPEMTLKRSVRNNIYNWRRVLKREKRKKGNNIKIGSAVSRLFAADKQAGAHRRVAAATTRGPLGRCSALPYLSNIFIGRRGGQP